VLVDIAYPVQRPEEIIPSLIWLESPQQREDSVAKVLTASACRSFEIGTTAGKRECARPGVGFSSGGGKGVAGIVESLPKAVGGLASKNSETFREGLYEIDLVVKAIRVIRISLTDTFVRLAADETLDARFEILNMLLCARNL
jgi:hypothetical protein